MVVQIEEYRSRRKVELCVGKEENGFNNSTSRENFWHSMQNVILIKLGNVPLFINVTNKTDSATDGEDDEWRSQGWCFWMWSYFKRRKIFVRLSCLNRLSSCDFLVYAIWTQKCNLHKGRPQRNVIFWMGGDYIPNTLFQLCGLETAWKIPKSQQKSVNIWKCDAFCNTWHISSENMMFGCVYLRLLNMIRRKLSVTKVQNQWVPQSQTKVWWKIQNKWRCHQGHLL